MPDDTPATTPSAPKPAGSTPAASAPKPPEPAKPAPAARPFEPKPAPMRRNDSDLMADGVLVVGKGVTIDGQVRAEQAVLVEGELVNAGIEAGQLVIGQSGKISGQANVTTAEIHGSFTGDLKVTDCLVVHETGSVSGTIRYGEFQATRGARLEGDIRGIDGPSRPAPAAAPAADGDKPAPSDTESRKRSLFGRSAT